MGRGWATTSSQTAKGRSRNHRQEVHCWPLIRAWLEAPVGWPPLPVCSACSTELAIWGIPPEEGPELPLTPESPEESETATPGTPSSQTAVARAREGTLLAEVRCPPQWGEDEWQQRLRDQAERRTAAGRAGDTVYVATEAKEDAARAVLLPCGYMVCPRCFGNRVVVTRSGVDKRCPAYPWCSDDLKSRHKCGHIVSHLLPGRSDAEGLERVPRSGQLSNEDRSRLCWKCQNLALTVRIGDDEWELPFGATIPASTCPPETPVSVSYYHRRDANSASALMLVASLGFGGMGSVLAAGMVGRPRRVVVLEGRPYSEAAKWGLLRTGFLSRRRDSRTR